jgi:hypothetical protein
MVNEKYNWDVFCREGRYYGTRRGHKLDGVYVYVIYECILLNGLCEQVFNVTTFFLVFRAMQTQPRLPEGSTQGCLQEPLSSVNMMIH